MFRYLTKSILLLALTIVICCIIYPLAVWGIGQVFFPFQANGSLLKGPDGSVVGSKLIAQPFTKDEYFQPRPSAASHDGTASASGSGLDPDISLENAEFQLDRVAGKWSQNLKRDPAQVRREIKAMLRAHAFSPDDGLFDEPTVNVLELNLDLRTRYGAPF